MARCTLTVCACLLIFAPAASAQKGAIDLQATFGDFIFYDDGYSLHHFYGGASARFYLISRLSVVPEIAYVYRNSADSELMLLPNVAWDFRSAEKRFIPYVIGGVGVFRARREFPGGSFTEWDEHFSFGGGAKIYLSDAVFVAPEFRLGASPSTRWTVGVGYSWRR
jgi:hypothetical protein